MKTKTKIIVSVVLIFCAYSTRAQFVTIDPANLAQGIVNTAKQIVQTASTASTALKNFKETSKIYEQGKKYYEALKSVNNLVKDARRVQETLLMVGEITQMYVVNFRCMTLDKNYTINELNAIGFGYAKILEESSGLINDLKIVINQSTLSMNDKERMDSVNEIYYEVRKCRNLVYYYTRKNISISYIRAKRAGDTRRVAALYGSTNDRHW